MIMLTTLRGDRFAVNPDLIEEIRANGTTCVVGMVTGRSYTAAENIDVVHEALVDFRVSVLSAASTLPGAEDTPESKHTNRPGHLSPVPDEGN
ncbi:flagellar FlbD family protein (plasmid) [Citricoccus nitrophenolicus]